MIVYRYVRKSELLNILNGNLSNVGSVYTNNKTNTFKYNANERYLHFFKRCKDIDYIRKLALSKSQHFNEKMEEGYICLFNIPSSVLLFSAGHGFYENSGYESDCATATEFAIKVKKFKPRWLVGYVKDNINSQFNPASVQRRLKSGFSSKISID